MDLSRRDFIKLSGLTTGGMLLPRDIAAATKGMERFRLHKPIGETHTICCFCGVGCGAIVAAENGQVVNLEGDPDHPINRGSLCSKGMSLAQLHTVDGEINSRRLNKVRHRKPGSSKWEEMEWGEAFERIAKLIKKTRDDHFNANAEDSSFNRLPAIASLGGASLDNEECSLIVKALRAMGLVYIEHQARI